MNFNAEIIKEESMDPYFKIKFSYETDSVSIKRGFAEVFRQAPKPVIKYGPSTDEKLRDSDKAKLELEILNTIVDYLFSKGASRTFKGNLILHTA